MDFQKLADKLGYKNVRSAADSYYRFRRGLDLGVSSSSSSSSNPSTRSSIRKKPRLRKRKVIYSDDDGGEEEEEEEEGGEDEDSGSGGDAAGCEIKQECTEGDGVRIKLEGDNEEAIFVKSESEGEDDDGHSAIGRNNRRRSREEGGCFSGFRGTEGYRHASTGTGSGFEGVRFDGYGVLGGLPPPLVVVERALPEKVVEKEGVVVIKDEPVAEEKWVWKW